MRSKNTTKVFTPRQPESTGPDVVYNGSDFDAFSNGTYICSRSNSQDAWIEARRIYFQVVEDARVESAAPAITALPHICDDRVDTERLGKQIWTDYRAGTDSKGSPTDVTIYEDIVYAENNEPTLYAFGLDGISLDEVERVLPQIIALLNDPTVKAARLRWAELVTSRQMKQAA